MASRLVCLLLALSALSGCQSVEPVGGQGNLDALTWAIRDANPAQGETVGLIPPFEAGTAKLDVERRLGSAGYALFNTGIMPPRPGHPSLGVYGKTMGKGYQVDPCQVRYNITVHFDAADRLTSAEGAWSDAGCL